MKHINLTQMLQGCSKRNGMTVRASNPDGEPTVNRQSRLMSLSGKKAEKEQLSPSCLLSASFPLSFRSRYLRYAAVIFCVLVMSIGEMWGAEEKIVDLTANTSSSNALYEIADADNWGSGSKKITLALSGTRGQKSTGSYTCFSSSKTYYPSFSSSCVMTFSLPSDGDFYISKVVINCIANSTTASACGGYEFQDASGTVLTGASNKGTFNAMGYTACENVTFTPTAGAAKKFSLGRGVNSVSGSEGRLAHIEIWVAASAASPKYTLSYDANGGTGSMPTHEFASGTTVYAAQNAGFTAPSGKIFKCWNTKANGSGTSYGEWASFTLSANTTLYAQWITASTSTTYCISLYNLNVSDQMKYFTYSGSSDMQILDLEVPDYQTEKNNFWVGKGGSWKSGDLGNSKASSANERLQDLCLKGNRGQKLGTGSQGVLARFFIYDNSTYNNLYIEFTPKQYSLIWGEEGKTWSPVKLYPSGCENEWTSEVVTLTSDHISSDDWKYYVGILKADDGVAYWYKSKTSTIKSMGTYNKPSNSWGGNVSTLSAGDKGFFRMWQDATSYDNWRCHFVPVYTLSYNANSGTGAPANAYTATEGDATARTLKVSMTEPTRNGYSFQGWATSSGNASAGKVDYAPGASITLSADQELWAVWECVDPTITTDLSEDEVDYYVGASATALTVAATAAGGSVSYQWYSNDEKNTTTPTTLTTGASYTPSTAAAGTTYYYCVVTNSTVGCSTTTTSSIAKIVVSRQDPTTQTFSAASTSICSGSDATFTLAGSQVGATYYLTKASGGGSAIGDSKAGTGSALTFTATSATTGDYYCWTSQTTAFNAKKVSKSKVTISYKTATSVTVDDATLDDAVVDEEYTISGITGAGAGTLYYQWYSYSDDEGSDETAIVGADADTYAFTPDAEGNYYFKCKVTGDCGSVKSELITVTASPGCDDPSASLNNGAYTIGGSALDLRTLWSSSNTTDGVTFSVTNANGTGATIAGDGYSFSATTAGTATISASQTSTGDYCDVAATSATITVSNPTYTVTYTTTGSSSGTAPTDSNSPYESGSTVTVKGNTGSLVKTGNVFLGWSDGSGNNYAPGETFTISGNTTLSPIWKEGTSATVTYTMAVGADYAWSASGSSNETTGIPNAGVTITETYAGIDNGKGHKNGSTAKLAIQTTAQGATYDSPTNYILYNFSVASGYAFTPSDITIKIANVGEKSANNIKYKAVLSDASSHSISTTYICTTQDATIETFHLYNEEGVTFDGNVSLKLWAWKISSTANGSSDSGKTGSAYRLGTPLTIAGVTESTATLYDISTSAANGTIAVTVGGASASSAEVDATVTITATPSSGYSFSSWSVEEDDSGDDVSVTSSTTNPTTFTMPAADVTVSATFTPNTYYITYNLNGASWAGGYSAPAKYTVGTGATLPVAGDMTNTGYTFGGWFADDDLETGGVKTEVGTSEYDDKEFWAKWTENTYTITYNKNDEDATGTTAATEGHYVTVASCGFELDGHLFTGWNTASDGSGDSYSAGAEIELRANMTLYAQWATDYTITWGNVQIGGAGATVTPNLGGGNYTITANTGSWTGSLTADMVSTETSGVTITNVAVNNSASPKTITVTFAVGATVVGESIGLTLSVPAAGAYGAKESTESIDIERCTGSDGGSDGVLFDAEFKDSGLGTSDVCTAANTPYTFTTTELKSAAVGGSIKAYTTSNLSHMKFATNAISIAGSDGVIQIDLSSPLATNDLFTYHNVNTSTSSAYLRHTSPTNTTDQIALTVYNKESKVRLTSGFNGKSTLYIVRNNKDFKLHKAAVVRPAFLMLLRDDAPTSDTNLEGTDVELTTETYLTTINGGRAYYTSPSSGNLKIKRNSSKNYIQFNSQAGYIKVVLDDDLQEGDVIGFDSYGTNELALTTTATRSTTIRTTSQLYTVGSSSALKGQTTFYLWQNSGTSDYLRGLQIARSGIAGGSSGTDQITTTLTWDNDLSGGVNAEVGEVDFTHSATQDKNSLGAITYSSNNTAVATVNASGKVHIVGAGDATITATLAESGCYKSATATYSIHVVDNCADGAGTVSARALECDGTELTVSGYTSTGSETFQWYKDGVSLGGSYTAAKCTVTVAGEYYVVVDNTAAGSGHCTMASSNTVDVEAAGSVTATKIVNSWYVKNGRRTPDIALVQTENATSFTVKEGETVIWKSNGNVKTGFGNCGFRLGDDGIIYLKGTQDDGNAPSGLSAGDVALKIQAEGCGTDPDELSITIHKQGSTSRKSVAFVSLGGKAGAFNDTTAGYYKTTPLYKYLDNTLSGGDFDLTAQNVYSTVNEQTIREHYSQFDAILITDDPSTGETSGGKSYVDAFGTMIDVRPILTMEAFVSKLSNWKAKGINGNPESPNPRQYAMKLQCKDHDIFSGLSVGTNVSSESVDGVDYWTVTMVDKTKSPYSGKASDTDDTRGTPALQGFSASDVSGLLLLGEIKNGEQTMYAGIERQEEPAARMMLLGLNSKALPNALTVEGKTIVKNALNYLLKTNMEEVDDCSNYFTGATSSDWNTPSNWSKNRVPYSPMVRARILAPCVIADGTIARVSQIDIAVGGTSSKKAGEINGSLTVNAGGSLIVGGKIRRAEAPNFGVENLKPTEAADLVINTGSTAQAALILDNEEAETQATVNLYSLGRKESGHYQFQYYAVPMDYVSVSESFAGSDIYTYVWHEATGWERRGYYTDLYAFEGVGITTKLATPKTYTMKGALASTATKEITLTKDADGYNLIGNSWTAPIQISQLEEDNGSLSNKTVYIYNAGNDTVGGSTEGTSPGQWTAIPFSAAGFGAWSGLKVIPAMQAFELVPTSEETLTLDYEKVVRGDNKSLTEPLHAPRRVADHAGIELMRIRVADSKTHTDLHLFEGERFSDEFDNGWEAAYMDGDDGTTKLYADVALGRMAVVATDELEGTLLGFAPGKETEYTFTFGGEGMGYYLNDLKLKTSTLISEEATYSFTYEEGDTNRFYISRTRIDAPQTPTGVENTHGDAVKARKFIYNDKLYIMLNGRVYSAEGQIVK